MRSLPAAVGERNAQLFKLAARLKELVPVATTAKELQPVLTVWFRLAEPVIGTKSLSVCWSDFRRAWETAAPISASRPLALMSAVAGDAAESGADTRAVLLAACRALARQSPSGTFYLSCRTAEQLAATSRATANRILNRLVAAGQLVVVTPGLPGARSRKATEYRLGRS